MKITILNGNPDPLNEDFENYVNRLSALLTGRGHQVDHVILRDRDLKYCIGCFGCWVKTPGECVAHDDGDSVRRSVLASDFLLWAAPLVLGYPSALLKRMIDKSIPLVHPYFAVVHGEAHHRARYDRYPLTGLLIQPEADTLAEDLQIVEYAFRRTALNMKSHLCFMRQTVQPVEETAAAIETSAAVKESLPPIPAAVPGNTIPLPERMLVFNGSPRGHNSNTNLLLSQFIAGFQQTRPECQVDTLDLVHINHHEEYVEKMRTADVVFIGFPLYVDAMPGTVKTFIERLQIIQAWQKKPALGFLVQSGFPESAHSRFVEHYLARLAGRLGCVYAGTIVKGGCEGIREQSEKMTAGLFSQFHQIGLSFGQTGRLDPALLKKLSTPEKYSPLLIPVFYLLSAIGLLNFWWDMQLKQNGAYEQRFARPLEGRQP